MSYVEVPAERLAFFQARLGLTSEEIDSLAPYRDIFSGPRSVTRGGRFSGSNPRPSQIDGEQDPLAGARRRGWDLRVSALGEYLRSCTRAQGGLTMRRTVRSAVALTLIFLSLPLVGAAAELTVPPVAIDLSGHPFRGPADAPVTIVDFFDYL